MAKVAKAPQLSNTKMVTPKDDSRDEQFHLDITVKNTAACYAPSAKR